MIRDSLATALRAALTDVGIEPPAEIHLERPGRREHGDWSSNVAMATAKSNGRVPRDLAGELVERLSRCAARPRRAGRDRRPGVRELPPARDLAPRRARRRPRRRARTATPASTSAAGRR